MSRNAGAGIPNTGTLKTRVGDFEVRNGYPTETTVAKLFDEMDFQRAVQAYLWALPYVSMGQLQSEQRDKFDAQNLDFVDYIDLKDRLGMLTANATTPYSFAFPNLARTGPLVIEIPPGSTAGGIADFWQRPAERRGEYFW